MLLYQKNYQKLVLLFSLINCNDIWIKKWNALLTTHNDILILLILMNTLPMVYNNVITLLY